MNGWTPERQARQSALIHTWRPWEKTAGPKTPQGKARVSRNAYKGGTRVMLRELARLLREQREAVKRIAAARGTSRLDRLAIHQTREMVFGDLAVFGGKL